MGVIGLPSETSTLRGSLLYFLGDFLGQRIVREGTESRIC